MKNREKIVWQRTYKNNVTTGNTIIIIKKLKNYYRIYDHCVESLTSDGTGINKKTTDYEYAVKMAILYGESLVVGRMVDIRADNIVINTSHDGSIIWVNDESHCILRISGIKNLVIEDNREPDPESEVGEKSPGRTPDDKERQPQRDSQIRCRLCNIRDSCPFNVNRIDPDSIAEPNGPDNAVRIAGEPRPQNQQSRDCRNFVQGFLIPGMGVVLVTEDEFKKVMDKVVFECPVCGKINVKPHPHKPDLLVCHSCGTSYIPRRE